MLVSHGGFDHQVYSEYREMDESHELYAFQTTSLHVIGHTNQIIGGLINILIVL